MTGVSGVGGGAAAGGAGGPDKVEPQRNPNFPLQGAKPSYEQVQTTLMHSGGWQLKEIDGKEAAATVKVKFFLQDPVRDAPAEQAFNEAGEPLKESNYTNAQIYQGDGPDMVMLGDPLGGHVEPGEPPTLTILNTPRKLSANRGERQANEEILMMGAVMNSGMEVEVATESELQMTGEINEPGDEAAAEPPKRKVTLKFTATNALQSKELLDYDAVTPAIESDSDSD